MCMCVFRFFFDISEATEDKVHVGPPRDRGRKFIQMVQVFFILILSAPGGGGF